MSYDVRTMSYDVVRCRYDVATMSARCLAMACVMRRWCFTKYDNVARK